MTLSLIKQFARLWSLEAGVAMVLTDLHGDWDAYRRYRDCFLALQAKGQADWLIFSGDLIHCEKPDKPDHSIEIVLDVLDLQASHGQAVIYLCGNHELPHLYGFSLAKGDQTFTPAFEAALINSQRRAEIIALFDTLPFYVRTRAGVTVTHAGAAALFSQPDNAFKLFNWNHRDLFDWADEYLAGEDAESLRQGFATLHHAPYDMLAKYFLAISGPADPRYNDLLRGYLTSNHPDFTSLLWPALFTRCEQEYGQTDYAIFLDALLQELSQDFYQQQALVAGHMPLRRGGCAVIAKRHIRLASAHHARPREAGQYLIFDTEKPFQGVKDVMTGLKSVY
jgi:hypothetical protein